MMVAHRVGDTSCCRHIMFKTHRVGNTCAEVGVHRDGGTSSRGHIVQSEGYIVMVARRVGGISSRGYIVENMG